MKGVILAGGLGSRLRPLTKITNKHLLPIYDRPMIFYPIQAMINAGIKDIMIVCGGNHAGEFLRLLGNGKDFGLKHLNYTYQEGEGGIADALALTRFFVDDDRVAVMLGDNIIENNFLQAKNDFEAQETGAKILLKEVTDPRPYGVAEVSGGKVLGIEEKPQQPKSNLAVIGIYFFDNTVFKIVDTLKPSGRGGATRRPRAPPSRAEARARSDLRASALASSRASGDGGGTARGGRAGRRSRPVRTGARSCRARTGARAGRPRAARRRRRHPPRR